MAEISPRRKGDREFPGPPFCTEGEQPVLGEEKKVVDKEGGDVVD